MMAAKMLWSVQRPWSREWYSRNLMMPTLGLHTRVDRQEGRIC